MEIRGYQENQLRRLYEYWWKVGTDAPYFYPVSAQKWQTCLLEDELDGERIFKWLETYYAEENGQVLGFVQYGQPNFAWDGSGQKVYDPHIGVIRHLFFDKGRVDVGKALQEVASGHLACFDQNHAFFHILGMSCNAHHGKLHNSQSHVDDLLREYGFQIEHENPYYVLDMENPVPQDNVRLQFYSLRGSSEEMFEIRLGEQVVGSAQVRYIDRLTDGYTRDVAYLTWIGVVESHRNHGIGTEFLDLLVQFLSDRRYRYLHTDTARGNLRAQHFYRKLGFQSVGFTRSYVQISSTLTKG